jgi:hypothetical protein
MAGDLVSFMCNDFPRPRSREKPFSAGKDGMVFVVPCLLYIGDLRSQKSVSSHTFSPMPSCAKMAAYLLKIFGIAVLFTGVHSQVYGTAGGVGSGPEGIGPTVIDWEGPLVPQDYSKPLFNDYGFVVRGNLTNGEDFTLWLFIYRQIGEAEFITDEDLFQLTFIHGNFTEIQKESMNDTPFVNIGQDIEDYAPIGTVTAFQNSSYVEYTFEDFKFGAQDTTSREKIWLARGSRGGVTVDILMPQHGDEIYHAGAFTDLENCSPNTTSTNYNCTGDFGGIVHTSGVTGTFSYNDTTVTIDTAYAVHERLIQAGAIPSRVLTCGGNGATWIHSWGNRLDTWAFTTDYGPLSQAFVNID